MVCFVKDAIISSFDREVGRYHMPETRTKVTEGGRIVIPAEYRQALGLQVGDEIIVRLEEDGIHIFTLDQAIKYVQDILRPYLPQGRSLSDELIAERRLEN